MVSDWGRYYVDTRLGKVTEIIQVENKSRTIRLLDKSVGSAYF